MSGLFSSRRALSSISRVLERDKLDTFHTKTDRALLAWTPTRPAWRGADPAQGRAALWRPRRRHPCTRGPSPATVEEWEPAVAAAAAAIVEGGTGVRGAAAPAAVPAGASPVAAATTAIPAVAGGAVAASAAAVAAPGAEVGPPAAVPAVWGPGVWSVLRGQGPRQRRFPELVSIEAATVAAADAAAAVAGMPEPLHATGRSPCARPGSIGGRRIWRGAPSGSPCPCRSRPSSPQGRRASSWALS